MGTMARRIKKTASQKKKNNPSSGNKDVAALKKVTKRINKRFKTSGPLLKKREKLVRKLSK